MKIKNIIDRSIIPDYVNINNVNLGISINVKDLDLDEIFNKVELATNNIQIIRYKENIKFSDNLTNTNKRILSRFNEQITKKKPIIYFHNMMAFFFKRSCFRLFKNGSLLMTGKANVSEINKHIKTIFKILEDYEDDIKMLNIKLNSSSFNIGFSSIDIEKTTQKLLSNEYREKMSMHIGARAKTFARNGETIYIFNKSILGMGYKSFQSIKDVTELIREFIEIEDISKNIANASDDHIFEISI